MQDDHAGSTILVVEDDVLIRMLGTDILEEAGFEVLEASNADEAVEMLGKHPDVRLLFSDVEMPGSMDGVDLARLVHERWPAVRLLLTSGHYRLRDAAVPDDGRFIHKPWTPETLIGKVRALLNG